MTTSSPRGKKLWRIALPLPIRTDRLLLRPCREGDGVALAEAVAESFETLHPWFHDAMREYEDEASADWQEVVACRSLSEFKARDRLQFLDLTADGTLAGSVDLFDPDWTRRSFRLAFWLRPRFARHGYMTEGATAILKYAFSVLKARRVTTGHAEPNKPSAGLIRKLGFRKLSSMPMGAAMPDGTYVDGISYVMTEPSGLPDVQVSWGQSDPA
ncbi:MAG: GNAT family N-acetyltransferase [Pseudomonadota bacterium]